MCCIDKQTKTVLVLSSFNSLEKVSHVLLCLLELKFERVVVSFSQAPQLLWRALREAGPTAQACVSRRTANPVWEDFTATLLASLNLLDFATRGTPNSDGLRRYIVLVSLSLFSTNS